MLDGLSPIHLTLSSSNFVAYLALLLVHCAVSEPSFWQPDPYYIEKDILLEYYKHAKRIDCLLHSPYA